MRKTFLLAILSAGYATFSFAQTEDPLSAKKEKQYDHYIGVQMNGLIKQVFNFSNSTTSVNTNPYLLTYNINSIKKGWGLRMGVGYNYNSSTTADAVTSRTSDINDLQLRIGAEKAFSLSDKWTTGAGIDILYNKNDDKTTAITTNVGTTTTSTTITHTVASSFGGGTMAWLRYNISKKLLIGTETSLYYLKGKSKISVSSQISSGGNTVTNDTDNDDKLSTATISLPLVFYLIVKF